MRISLSDVMERLQVEIRLLNLGVNNTWFCLGGNSNTVSDIPLEA